MLYAKRHDKARTLALASGETWPATMESFLRRALAREPGGRFSDAQRMREAWRLASSGDSFPSLEVLRARAPDPG